MTNPQRIKDPGQRIAELERRIERLERGSKARLSAAVIGEGGVTVRNSGSVTLEDGGSIRVRDGGDILVYYPENTGGGVAVRIHSDSGVAGIAVNAPDGREVARVTANVFGAIFSSHADQIDITADGSLAPTAQFGVKGNGNPGIFVQNGFINIAGGNQGIGFTGYENVTSGTANVRLTAGGVLQRIS